MLRYSARVARRAVLAPMGALAWLLARWRFWLVVAVVNVVLLAVYLWSRPGSTTTLRVEAVGNEFRAYVDGEFHGRASYDAFPTGGIGLRLSPENSIPSLPGSSKLESVKVTDAATGDVLFEDSFKGDDAGPWTANQGEWVRRGGAYGTTTGGTATIIRTIPGHPASSDRPAINLAGNSMTREKE